MRPPSGLVASSFASLVAALFACDVAPPSPASDGPVVLASSPEAGETDVPRLGPFRVLFDRPLFVRTVHRGTVRVRSGVIDHLLSIRFDPVDREVVAVPLDWTPLEPHVRYRLRVSDVRDLDDRVLASPFEAAFTTGDAIGEPYVPESATFAEVAPILAARCADAGCHGTVEPALGLDLSSADGVARTAIGVASRQLPRGTAGSEGAGGALSFSGLDLVRVVGGVGEPAESYLLYKVLGDPHVLGEGMPPASAGAPLDDAEIHAISAWIEAGAPLR